VPHRPQTGGDAVHGQWMQSLLSVSTGVLLMRQIVSLRYSQSIPMPVRTRRLLRQCESGGVAETRLVMAERRQSRAPALWHPVG
jgi:hypothetical protein